MSKKTERKRLTELQFWRWRAAVEELMHAQTSSKLALIRQNLMEKSIEADSLKLALYRHQVKATHEKELVIKESYTEAKKRIEGEVGQSLSGTAIDEVTFEIKPLDESKKLENKEV